MLQIVLLFLSAGFAQRLEAKLIIYFDCLKMTLYHYFRSLRSKWPIAAIFIQKLSSLPTWGGNPKEKQRCQAGALPIISTVTTIINV